MGKAFPLLMPQWNVPICVHLKSLQYLVEEEKLAILEIWLYGDSLSRIGVRTANFSIR